MRRSYQTIPPPHIYKFNIEIHALKKKPYWGNHFWTEGHCVDTVGLDSEMIRKYVKYQEIHERKKENQGKLF